MKKKFLLIFSLFLAFQLLVGLTKSTKVFAAGYDGCCNRARGTCVAIPPTLTCGVDTPCVVGGVLPEECKQPQSTVHIDINAPESVKITDFGKLFSGAVGFILLIAFIMAFLYLVLGGLSWITSGGDKAAVETARNKIINALIGLIIVASTWALFQLVGGAIGFNILGGFKLPSLY